MAVPIPWYERAATRGKTLWSLVQALGHMDMETNRNLAETIRSARARLEACYELLRQENPKSAVLLDCLRARLASGGKNEQVGILVRDRAMAEALRVWLQTSEVGLCDARLRIGHNAGWDTGEPFDEVFLTGSWPSRYRWQIAGHVANTLTFLLYPGEEGALEAQLRRFHGRSGRERRAAERRNALAELGCLQAGENRSALTRANGNVALVEETLFTTRAPVDWQPKHWMPALDLSFEMPQSSLPGLTVPALTSWLPDTEAEEWDDTLDDVAAEELAAQLARTPGDSDEVVVCVEIQVRARRTGVLAWLYLDAEAVSEVLTPDIDGLVEVANVGLEPGMTLVGTNEGKRQDLFEQLLELAHAMPELRPLKALHQSWRDGIEACAEQFRSGWRGTVQYDALLAALRKQGAPITDAQSLRQWVTNCTLGPGDARSIRAVGRVACHPILSDSSKMVHDALNGIRSVHRAMGRRLSTALRDLAGQEGSTGQISPPPRLTGLGMTGTRQTQNSALSVPLEELVDAMEFWQIEMREAGVQPIPAALVGRRLSARWQGCLQEAQSR